MPEDINHLRLKALELAAAAVTAGSVHHYDGPNLAHEYLAFLMGTSQPTNLELPFPLAKVDETTPH